MHVAQEVDVGKVEVASTRPRSASVLTEEMTEKDVQLVPLSDQNQPHECPLSLLTDQLNDGQDLSGQRIVAHFERRFIDVNLRCRLHSKNVVNPRWIYSQTNVHKHVDAVLQNVHPVVGNFFYGASKGVR